MSKAKVGVVLPENQSKGRTIGTWVSKDDSDVHCYMQSKQMVVGHNREIKNMKFTHACMIFDNEGKVFFQYADKNGQCQNVEISADLAYTKISEMLISLRSTFI